MRASLRSPGTKPHGSRPWPVSMSSSARPRRPSGVANATSWPAARNICHGTATSVGSKSRPATGMTTRTPLASRRRTIGVAPAGVRRPLGHPSAGDAPPRVNLGAPVQDDSVVPARPLRRDRTEALLSYAEALARVTASGGGAPALAAHLAAALDAAVLVEDAQWRHVAVSGTSERAIPATGRDLLPKDADGDDGTGLAAPADQHARAYPLRAGEARLGWLSVFPASARTQDDRAGLIRLTAAQIAVELSREAGGGRGRRRGFWDRLLARAYEDSL